ncbi:MAG: DotI/IcmL/TraM family protein [Alphaproteobacteria bacterium]|nr:DotI/IcmL/TraM family protein [Alphaproteobacteria bacterium]
MDSDAIVKTASGTEQQESIGVPEGYERIWAENNYYRDGFRNMLWIANIQVLIILALAAFFTFYVKTSKNEDRFFAEAAEGRQMQVEGLDLPNMGKMALTNWVAQAATQIMTFGFNDIDQQFAVSQLNFTAPGWESFYKAMTASKLIENVIEAQQIVTSVPLSPPILLQEGLIEGKYSWVFEMQMLITFRSGGVKQVNTKRVRVVVERVPTSDNPNGIGIGKWFIF